MRRVRFLTALLLSNILILSGCAPKEPADSVTPSGETDPGTGDNTPETPPEPVYKQVTVKMDTLLSGERSTCDLNFEYNDVLFDTDAKEYNKRLSLLSFANSVATAYPENGQKFYTDLEFSDITVCQYSGTITKDTVGHFFAHKKLGEFEIFAVNFQGFYYEAAWTNNFQIGKTGDHEGFMLRANEVYIELQDYITSYKDGSSIKLWINGYSRGGALSNALAYLIMSDDKIAVTQSNLFVYTFEAPAPLSEEHAIAYENVHNVINSNDLITNVPPAKYGLKRCGVDYEIYDANVSAIAKEFDQSINIPAYGVYSGINNDTEFMSYLIGVVFDSTKADDLNANNRNNYVDNYQTGLGNFVGYIFMLSSNSRSLMLAALTDNATTIISDSTGAKLRDFIKPYMVADNIPFTEDGLLSDCAVTVKAITNLFLEILLNARFSDSYKGDLMRLFYVHFPEVDYALILNAHSK